MTSKESDAVELEIRIAASPETVYAFFIDATKMVRWKGVTAALDPRPGGMYRVHINGHDIVRGEYVEITPYSRVVFTWGWEGEGSLVPPGSSTVEITLVPDGDGTLARLRHFGLPTEQKDVHAEGWRHYMPRLATVAAGGDPGPDPYAASDGMEGS